MRSTLTELASGVDAFYASSRSPVPKYQYDGLATLKTNAFENQIFTNLTIGGERFEVLPYSWQKYPVALVHPHGQLGFTDSAHIPSIRLQLRSEFIHAVGAQEALDWFTQVLNSFEIYPSWTLSRVDLYVDVQGWDLSYFDKERFLCRAKDISIHEVDGQFSGFNFGKRKSKTITSRIYNKTLELKTSRKFWTTMAWNEKYDTNQEVYRIEFEFNREALKQFGLSQSGETLDAISGLWAFATQQWLTHRDLTDDSNKSRWPISPEWTEIQSSSIAGSKIPLERIQASKDSVKLDALIPALRGYLTSTGSLMGAEDLKSTMQKVSDYFAKDEAKTGITFANLILEKKFRRA